MSMEFSFKLLSSSDLQLISGGEDKSREQSVTVTMQPTASGQGTQVTTLIPVSPNMAVGPTVIVNPTNGQINGGGAGVTFKW